MDEGRLEIVLMRQLASYLAVPILVVDRHLDLLFFNESAEPVLGRRFEETGEIRRGEWSVLFRPVDERGVAIPGEEQPLSLAVDRGQPSHTRFRLTGLDGVCRHVEGVAFPLETQEAGLLGAAGIFWEVREAVPDAAPAAPAPRHGSLSRHDVEVILLVRLVRRLRIPTILVDPEGRLIFYNRAAEPVLGRPFAALGSVPFREWYEAFQPTDEGGSPIKLEDHPLSVARTRQRPSHRRFFFQGLDGRKHAVEGTAFPLVGQCDRRLGAVGFFWEGAR